MVFIEKDEFSAHTKRVAALEQAGIAPPEEWTAVRQRFDQFLGMKTPCRDRLSMAIICPESDEDITLLRAAAFAEQTLSPAVNHNVKSAVYVELVNLYSPVARSNFKKIATQFDSAARMFTAAADIVDPEAPAEAMVAEPQAQRTAWSQAPLHAGKLDALMPALIAGAELCGPSIVKDERMLLALTVDDRGVHRRKLWEAWNSKDGRCGHWSAILAVGAAIRAEVGTLRPYALPKPLETRVEQRNGLTLNVTRDPEDQPEPAAIGA